MKRLFCYLTLLVAGGLNAAEFDYGLKARQIAPDVHVFVGRTEDFTPAKGSASGDATHASEWRQHC